MLIKMFYFFQNRNINNITGHWENKQKRNLQFCNEISTHPNQLFLLHFF